jgi:predicted ArsR family transcriptional regulator
LTSLERDGLIVRGKIQPSGGRPEQLYVLTPKGNERFVRQYSWFSEMLLQMLEAQIGREGLAEQLAAMGRTAAASIKPRLGQPEGSAERIAAIAAIMQEIGYDAAMPAEGEMQIEAHNCVFHKLAAQCPAVCSFDLALLSDASGCEVEHRTCMVRGSDACRFRFIRRPAPADDPNSSGGAV